MKASPANMGEVRRLFDLVCDLSPDRRSETFAAECADAATIAEVEDLLRADGATRAPMRAPMQELLASLPETELDVGDRLGAWRLLRHLAKGGMGAVYLADRADGHFEQQAAVKLIRGFAGAETLVHFARERQILATLQHPNIARLIDGGATPGGQPYLVMEYIEGVSIDVFCARHKLALDARLHLFQQVCQAVQFAHQRLIVHCDLKPSNVFVREDGTPVLLDFGIARALDRQRGTDTVGAGSGYFTPGYASPEQLRGEPVTAASDVYALGLILFEMITGRKARIDTADRTIALLANAEIRPSQLADAVPWRGRLNGDLDAIVLRATAAAPASRYATAAALANDIQLHRELRPVTARPPTATYFAVRLLRRRWGAVLGGALAVLLVAAFTWRLVAERDRARAAESEARVQATTAQRVSDFLVSVFNVSNPKLNQQRDVSAREVLDQGAARIDRELADVPRVKAKLLDTLATAYRYIGQPKRAAELFNNAIGLYLQDDVSQPLEAAQALSQLAVVYANNKFPAADAERAAQRSLELRQRFAADDTHALADSWNTLGVVFEANDRFDAAEDALQKSLALRRAAANREGVASTLHNLGLVASHRGDPKRALDYLDEALALKSELVGSHHRDYQITLELHAKALNGDGRHEEALRQLQENLALCEEIYGEDSSHTAQAHNELGSGLHDLGRFGDAVEQYCAALRIGATVSGVDSANYAVPLNNLASAYEDMGDYAEAIPLFRQSLALRKKTLADDAPMVLRAAYNLARILTKAGSLDEAKPLLDAAFAGFMKRYGDADASTAKAQLWIGEWRLRSDDVVGAAESLQRLQASKAPFSPLLRAQRATFAAEIAAARHDAAAALVSREDAWKIMRGAWGERHPLTAECAIAYATALADAGRTQEARAVAAPLLSIVEAAFSEHAPVRRKLLRLRPVVGSG